MREQSIEPKPVVDRDVANRIGPLGVSIVTGCYRSERFIRRIYDSLARQTTPPLEWIAVIDGKLDGTEDLLRQFALSSGFPIRIVAFPENRGATVAIAEGIRRAEGSFVMILDHDDELVPDGLRLMLDAWQAYTGDRHRLSGVGGRCLDPASGIVIGSPFPSNPCITNELELRHRFRVTGELTGMVRADLLKEHYVACDDFVTNGLVWRRIARKHDGIYLDSPIRIYHRDNPESMTLEGVVRNPAGQFAQIVADSNLSGDYLWLDPMYFLRELWHLVRIARHQSLGPVDVVRRLDSLAMRCAYLGLWLLTPWQRRRDGRKGIIIVKSGGVPHVDR